MMYLKGERFASWGSDMGDYYPVCLHTLKFWSSYLNQHLVTIQLKLPSETTSSSRARLTKTALAKCR